MRVCREIYKYIKSYKEKKKRCETCVYTYCIGNNVPCDTKCVNGSYYERYLNKQE